jgi:glycosyltransferase involved in cell wall biosynthesis
MDSPQAPQISVVVPTHGRPGALECVLAGLATQRFDQPFEVIVIQDGVDEQTAKMLSSLRLPFALTSLVQQNAGPSSARNRGVRAARASIILFLDDDIVPDPGLVAAHFAKHQSKNSIAVVGSIQLHPGSPFLFLGEATDWSPEHLRRCTAPGYKVVPQDVPGGNFSVRREDIDRAGGWNEQMLGGGEDRELAVRLVVSGVELVFAQEAVGQHYYCKDWASYLLDMYSAGPAGIHFFHAHPERLHDIPSTKWLSATDSRQRAFRLVRFVPDPIFRWTLSVFAPVLRRLRPRRFRRFAGSAARLTGLLWYARGFWNEKVGAAAFVQAVESSTPPRQDNLMQAHASGREK